MTHRLGGFLHAAVLSIAIFLALAAPALAHSPHPLRVEREATAVGLDPGLLATPAGAPQREAPASANAIPRAAPSAVAGLAVALALLLIARASRRGVAAAASIALLVLAFESGVHSVHHLGDTRGAAQCSVASAAPHLVGSPAEPPSVSPAVAPGGDGLIVAGAPALSSCPFRPDAGRAPPLPGSAA